MYFNVTYTLKYVKKKLPWHITTKKLYIFFKYFINIILLFLKLIHKLNCAKNKITSKKIKFFL